MNLIVTKDYETMSSFAANIFIAQICVKENANICITAGATPKRMYEIVAERTRSNSALFDKVKFYNFDEVDNGIESPITITALKELFFNKTPIKEDNICAMTYSNYEYYDDIIEENGGIDLLILGLGTDGHFCGNMPGTTKFNELIYKVPVSSKYQWYKDFNSTFSNTNIPSYFVTMGLKSILKAKNVVLIVNGKHKANIFKKFLESPITEDMPASGLKLHPNLTVLCDEEAYSFI